MTQHDFVPTTSVINIVTFMILYIYRLKRATQLHSSEDFSEPINDNHTVQNCRLRLSLLETTPFSRRIRCGF